MKRIHILLGGLLVVTAIFATISLQTNTGPIRMVTEAVTRILPANEQDITTSRDSSLSEQIDTTVRTSIYSPFRAQTDTDLMREQVSEEDGAAVSTAPVRAQTTPAKVQTTPAAIASPVSPGIAQATPAVKTAPVSPAGAQPGTTAKTGSGKGKSTVKIAKAIPDSAQPNTAVKTAQVSKQDSTAVKTTPVKSTSAQTSTAVKTPTVSEQDNTAVKASPVSAQPYSPGTTSPPTESTLGTLYVDGISGNDITGNGSSAKPWKTIKKAVGYLKPGDVLSIMGGVYRESLGVTKNGTSASPIAIGAFGNGEVIIDASLAIGEWTSAIDTTIKGIYKATCSFKPTAVVVNEQPIFPAFSLADIKQGEWYYDESQALLYLYPDAGIKPALDNIGVVESNEYHNAITLKASYVTIYGLIIRYAGGYGISITGNNNNIESCNIKFNGKGAIQIWPYGSTLSENNIVRNNHIYHNMLRNWPRGRYKWCCWSAGAGTRGPHTQFIGNVVHKNGGEGLLAYKGTGGNIWRNNIVYDNWSVNIYVDNQPNAVIEGNTIFSSPIDTHDLYHNGDADPGDNKNLRRLKAEGIMTADEDYKLTPPANLKNVKIIDNIISGCRRGITHYGEAVGSGLKDVYIANNTIIVSDDTEGSENFSGIRIPYNDGNNFNVVLENNLIYATKPGTYLLYLVTEPLTKMSSGVVPPITFKNVIFRGNTWYHATKTNSFHVGPTYHTTYDVDFNKWKSICAGNCINDSYSNITAKIKPILDKIELIKKTYK